MIQNETVASNLFGVFTPYAGFASRKVRQDSGPTLESGIVARWLLGPYILWFLAQRNAISHFFKYFHSFNNFHKGVKPSFFCCINIKSMIILASVEPKER